MRNRLLSALLVWPCVVGFAAAAGGALRRVQGKAEAKRLDLNVGGRAGPSLVDGKDYYLIEFETELPEAVNGGWTITLVTDKPITMTLNLEADLLSQSPDQKTSVFGPKSWNGVTVNPNLAKGRLWQSWQGTCDGTPLNVVESYLTYDPTAAPTPVPKRTISWAKPDVQAHAPVKGEKYNLAESLQLSILFYEAQRSGKMPPNKRIPWRFDSELDDGKAEGVDLVGGWHDAGDHIKFGLPLGSAATTLIWGGLAFEEGYRSAGELGNLLDQTKWALDYMVKCHTAPDEFFAQVSDKPTDHFDWTRPEDMNRTRRAYKVTCANPGSQPVLASAAALASGAILFKKHQAEFGKGLYDAAYPSLLLQHAEELFDFGTRCPGHYVHDGKVPADCCYSGGGWDDEEAWAALWLYQATGKQAYLDHVTKEGGFLGGGQSLYGRCCAPPGFNAETQYGWDNAAAGVNLLLANITNEKRYKDAVVAHVDGWAWPDGYTGKRIGRTPEGLSYVAKWGSLRVAANAAFIALQAAESGMGDVAAYRRWAKSQIYYVYGQRTKSGDVNKSYQMGFGDSQMTYPRNPHHRATSCDDTGKCECSERGSYHILYGAIVGGPTEDDYHFDKCGDFITNEVAIDYNAGFQGAVAGLKQLSAQGLLGDSQ